MPLFRSGDTVRVHEKIREGDKERIQVFEGLIIASKHGSKSPSATFIVRKISNGIGVEKIFPLHSPTIQKVEIVKHDKVRRGKLYYLRNLVGKKKKRRASKILGMVFEESAEQPQSDEEQEKEDLKPAEQPVENIPVETQNSTPKKEE